MTLMAAQTDEKTSPVSLPSLFAGYSLEITAKDQQGLADARALIPSGSPISITFLPGEDQSTRLQAARHVRQLGFEPVPHISARRLASHSELTDFLGQARAQAQVDRVFVIGGDAERPIGPFEDASAVILSGVLQDQGVRVVGIAGYPEPHPTIPMDALWRALKSKVTQLRAQGHGVEIVTQFGFEAAPILSWLERLRAEGVDAPVRIGLAGPTTVKSLLRFASRCGVAASAKVLAKYGVSLTNLLGTAGPDTLVRDLAAQLDERVHGRVGFHMYSFGSLTKTAGWVRKVTTASQAHANGADARPSSRQEFGS